MEQLNTVYDNLTSKRPCGPNKTAIRSATYDLAKNDPWKEPFESLPEHAFSDVADWERKLIQERVRGLRGTWWSLVFLLASFSCKATPHDHDHVWEIKNEFLDAKWKSSQAISFGGKAKSFDVNFACHQKIMVWDHWFYVSDIRSAKECSFACYLLIHVRSNFLRKVVKSCFIHAALHFSIHLALIRI